MSRLLQGSALRSSSLKIHGCHDQYVSIREGLVNELVKCVPGVLPPPSVGEAEHDLRSLSHNEALSEFIYGSSHEFGTDVIVLRRSYKQVVGIQADST